MEPDDLNPYAAPVALETPLATGPGALPPGPYGPYRDNRGLAKALVALLGLGILFGIIRGGLNLLYVIQQDSAEMDLVVKLESFLSIAIVTNLACMVVFGIWIVRSGKNAWLFAGLQRQAERERRPGGLLSLSSSSNPADTPGWAVGWYFIPIANLWKPYGAMRDIVKASTMSQGLPVYLLPSWWTLWLISGISDRVLMRASRHSAEWEPAIGAVVWTSASGLDIALHVMAIILVRSITLVQTDSAEAFAAPDGAELPQPH